MATFQDFLKTDIRVGKIIEVEDFPEAKKPAYKLTIDFGSEIGIKKSSVQIVSNYKKEELIGKQILGVVNFPPRKIGPFTSEVLTLGVPDEKDNCVLATGRAFPPLSLNMKFQIEQLVCGPIDQLTHSYCPPCQVFVVVEQLLGRRSPGAGSQRAVGKLPHVLPSVQARAGFPKRVKEAFVPVVSPIAQ